MKKILLASLSFLFAACSSSNNNKAEEAIPDTAAIPGKSFAVELSAENPVSIDSSEYVMYPLLNKQTDEESDSFLSKDRGRTFWNIIFYNTATKKSHLINEKNKMAIVSFNKDYSDYGSSGYGSESYNVEELGVTQTKGYVLYTVISSDYNHNGQLDSGDPEYLFISDRQGENFKQISPENKNVKTWDFIEKSGVILIQATNDKNNDKIFDENDQTISYAYNLKTGQPAGEVFSKDFTQQIDELHKKFWPAKKKE
jgi:hypothetical protein